MTSLSSYSKLINQDDEKEEWQKEGRDWCGKILITLLLVLGAFICGFVGYATRSYASHSIENTTTALSARELHCGNSSVEAQGRGCTFDLLTNNWMPQYCSDSVTNAEYRAWVMEPERNLGSWAFYHDDQAQHQIPSEDVLSSLASRRVYTTKEKSSWLLHISGAADAQTGYRKYIRCCAQYHGTHHALHVGYPCGADW